MHIDLLKAPPISEVSKEIKKLYDSVKQQEAATEQLINQVNKELERVKSLIEEKEAAHVEYR